VLKLRLAKLDRGHPAPLRALFSVMRRIMGGDIPDVIKTISYRPSVFGSPFTTWLHPLMRGPSPWSVGERELFAAYTSRLNQCPF
jgi:hypothetical protein